MIGIKNLFFMEQVKKSKGMYKKLFGATFLLVLIIFVLTFNINWFQGFGCMDGRGSSYYFEEKYLSDNINDRDLLEKISIASVEVNSCSDKYIFTKKIANKLETRTVYQTLFISNSEFKNKKKEVFAEFATYLRDYNLECNDCLFEKKKGGNVPDEVLKYNDNDSWAN